jgi:CrtC N-terminal lipocalin domain
MSAENTAQGGGWLVGDGLELGEQGIYKLPRDHAWHSGPTYFVNDYFEWHYFTFLGTDKKTGHEVSLFLCMFSAGWSKEIGRPLMFPVFAWHDTVTGEFQGTTFYPLGTFETSGSGTSDFGFTYNVKDPDEKGFETRYDHAQEKWAFKSFCTDKSKILGKPYQVDATGIVQEPGYVPAAYWGLESIGYNKLYNQNPETMYGLTYYYYYYFAPQMEMSGTVTLADGGHEIEGVAWYEHQWGNYRNTENARYFWGTRASTTGMPSPGASTTGTLSARWTPRSRSM